MHKLLQQLNNFALYLLVFTIVYENWDAFGTKGAYSITYFATILYIVSWVPLFRYNLSAGLLKRFGIPLFLFICVGIVSTGWTSSYATDLPDLLKTRWYQVVVLALLVSNHIYTDKKMIWTVYTIYAVSVFFMSILAMAGIGTTYFQGRILIFGENPNGMGTKAVVAFIIVLYYLIRVKSTILKKAMAILALVGFLSLVILTASRGALLSLFMGTFILIILNKMKPIKKITMVSLGLIFIIFFFQYVLESDKAFGQRIMNSVEKGDTGRTGLWESATNIIADNLFIGVGVPKEAFLGEMYKYSGAYMDAHNIFLYVLITTGITGFVFFIWFVMRLLRDLIKSFYITGNNLFAVIFLLVVLFWSKTGGAIASIYAWFFLATLMGITYRDLNDTT